MAEYQAYNCTVIGQRYIDKNKPCEDSSISYNDGDIHIAIVADGHGDKTCFRSNVGSRTACEVSLECMKSFALSIAESDKEELLFTPKSADKLVANLFNAILGCWTEKVLEDLKNNPPTEEEYESAGDVAASVYRAGKELPHIFGTTLIAMLMTKRYLLVLHQGDGRCVVLHEDGSVDHPVPWDPRCEGRNTASLCDLDVQAHWRYLVIDLTQDRIIGSYVVSDGIEDSFETMDEMNAYLCMHASDYVKMGAEDYFNALPAHFAALTKNGSRDDISIGCIINSAAVAAQAERYALIHEYYVEKGENRRANERLNSMKRKTEYLSQRLEQAKKNCERAKIEHENSASTLERLQNAVKAAFEAWNSMSLQNDQANEALIAAQKEYDEYMELRNTFVEKASSTQEKMDALSQKIQALSVNSTDSLRDSGDEADTSPIYTQPSEGFADFEDTEDKIVSLDPDVPVIQDKESLLVDNDSTNATVEASQDGMVEIDQPASPESENHQLDGIAETYNECEVDYNQDDDSENHDISSEGNEPILNY